MKYLFPSDFDMNGHDLIDAAIERHKPIGFWSLFSGGHDSLTSTHLASSHPRWRGVWHIDTGIGIPDTQEFVVETCAKYGWPLQIFRAVDCGQVYEDLVVRWGFPGPFGHGLMYNRLKERALRAAIRTHKKKRTDRIGLISGCRSKESVRRMGHVEPIQRQGVQVWTAIIHDWTSEQCEDYIDAHNLELNPVKDKLGMSGECLCGAFAHPGELDNIRFHYPAVAARIERIEAKVKAAGHDWGWNDRPQTKPKNCPSVPEGQSLCFACGKQ